MAACIIAFLSVLLACSTVQARCHIESLAPTADFLLKGTVLTLNGPLPAGCVLIRNGRLAYVGTDCGSPYADNNHPDTTIISCPSSIISPGFINLHEHLEWSTVTPLPPNGQLSHNRQDWRLGLQGITQRNPDINGSATDATAWGELRHLFSGTTSVVGVTMAPGLVRNLDYLAGLEDGLVAAVDTSETFPLDDADGPIELGSCDYGPGAANASVTTPWHRFMAHIAEGVDEYAHNEFVCFSNVTFDTTPAVGGGGTSTDLIAENLVLVQALALTEADYDLVAERGAKVVWSPRSNVFLYGSTLNVTYLLDAGIEVALGTDWLPTGSATMGREAVCAYEATKKSFGIELDAKSLWEMMTISAARVAGLERYMGSLEVGKMADIAVFGQGTGDAYGQAVYAGGESVELVVRAGKVMLAAEELKDIARGKCESILVGSVSKVVCVEEELGMSYAEFEASLHGVYPAVYSGVPAMEPPCVPVDQHPGSM